MNCLTRFGNVGPSVCGGLQRPVRLQSRAYVWIDGQQTRRSSYGAWCRWNSSAESDPKELEVIVSNFSEFCFIVRIALSRLVHARREMPSSLLTQILERHSASSVQAEILELLELSGLSPERSRKRAPKSIVPLRLSKKPFCFAGGFVCEVVGCVPWLSELAESSCCPKLF